MNLIRFEFGVVFSIWFCYDFDMVLIWFGNGAPFSGFPMGRLQKGNGNSPRTGVWLISRGFLWFWYVVIWFWYSFDTVCCDFEAIWMWFWHDSEMLPIYFQKNKLNHTKPEKKQKSHVWPTSKSQFWPISKSQLKPYQNQNCKTRPETNHNKKSSKT